MFADGDNGRSIVLNLVERGARVTVFSKEKLDAKALDGAILIEGKTEDAPKNALQLLGVTSLDFVVVLNHVESGVFAPVLSEGEGRMIVVQTADTVEGLLKQEKQQPKVLFLKVKNAASIGDSLAFLARETNLNHGTCLALE